MSEEICAKLLTVPNANVTVRQNSSKINNRLTEKDLRSDLIHGIIQSSKRIRQIILTDKYCFINYCKGNTGKG